MNFIIVTQGDILYTPAFFKSFFSSSYYGECKGVVIQDALGNTSYQGLAKRMHSFYGTKHFIEQGFRFVFKKIRAKLYNVLFKQPISIGNLTEEYDIPILPFDSVNTMDFKRWIKENDIELIISIAASELFDKDILELPRYGCINFHNAPLPNYRGMLPNFWQMYHDEDYSVLTVHTMTDKLDKGEIIYQQRTRIKPEYSLEDLILLTKRKSADALVKVLRQFENNEISYKPMPDGGGSYFTFPKREDVREFKANGKTLF